MRAPSALVLVVLAGLAGCAETPSTLETLDVPEPAPFVAIVQERPTLASVTVHETPEAGAREQGILGGERWAPRDAQLTYHGLGEVHDEWGRLIAAHIFRYNPMVYTITQLRFDPGTGQMDIDGEYQERRWEMYFDAADGRDMGRTDLDRGVRSFSDPAYRLPFGPGYVGGMLVSMVEYMTGDLTAPVSYSWREYNSTRWLEPYDGDRPLAGDCDMYITRWKTEGPQMTPSKPAADPYRSIACFDEGPIPLWHWTGNRTGGSLGLERRDLGFAWPGPLGDVLGPAPFDAAPMQPIQPLLATSDPIYVPPADGGDDWAKAVRDRVAALHHSVPYQRFEPGHGPTYAHHVVTGWPPHAQVMLGGLLDPVSDVARVDETAWVMVNDGQDWFWTNVHTLSAGEGRRHHLPDQAGYTFSHPQIRYPSLEELGDMVETTNVRGRVPELAPVEPRMLNWMVFPEFGYGVRAFWLAASHCFEVAQGPHFLMFDGQDGHLMAAGSMHSHENGCSTGSAVIRLGPHELTVFPATPERPFPVVLDDAGALLMASPL